MGRGVKEGWTQERRAATTTDKLSFEEESDPDDGAQGVEQHRQCLS
jgi:hypothetical protein